MSVSFGRAASLAGLLLIGALGAAYAHDRLRLPAAPALLPSFLPSPVEAFQASIERQVAQLDGRADQAVLETAKDMLARAPLETAPLIVAADLALQSGDLEAARQASELALARDPRNPALHAWLAEHAANQGDLARAVERLKTLLRLDPKNRSQYINALVVVALRSDGQALVERTLSEQPAWGPTLVAQLNRRHPDLAFLARINEAAPSAQPLLMRRLMDEAGPVEAYKVWRDLAGAEDDAGSWPYDPAFQQLPGPVPFNWRVIHPQATFEPRGGLYARHDGKGRVLLVEQIMLMPPGSYALTIKARTSRRATGAGLVWTLSCLESRKEIASIDLPDTARKEILQQADALVPDDCPAQRLTLSGTPGEFTIAASAEIASVDIEPADPQATVQ